MDRLFPETPSCLPHDARSGLMRAWLAILSARHPDVVWLPAERTYAGPPAALDKTPRAIYLLEAR
jgi:hypothetical protein